MQPLFCPSLMCMDFLDIKKQTEILNERCDMYHVDIMDGHYVKNITLSPDFVAAFAAIAKKPIDCHLMVTDPDDYIASLSKAGADYISLHAETINVNAFRLINKIETLGVNPGIVLNPATPLSYIMPYIHRLKKITIMTVDPGFAGQAFIEEMLSKIEEARDLKEKNNYEYIIEVDGSCNERTFKKLYDAGTEAFVVGSSGLFCLDSDLNRAYDKMTQIFNKECRK